LVLTACNTQRPQDDSHTTGAPNPTTQSGNEMNSTNPSSALKSLALTINKTTLNKDTNTTLKVTAVYKDGKAKDLTAQAEWIITPKDAVRITDHTLTSLKDTNVTVQAKVGNQTSNPVTLNIYWEVDGHRLPPEPDPQVNNTTLLGVDVNHNGVRDDVERWIYEEYKDKHPIYFDIAMQAARGYKLVLEKQSKTREEAKEIHVVASAALSCEAYYQIYAKYFNEPLLIKDDIVTKYFRKTIYFNTKRRMDMYIQYDILLSGDSYPTPNVDKNMTSYCDFNTSRYKE